MVLEFGNKEHIEMVKKRIIVEWIKQNIAELDEDNSNPFKDHHIGECPTCGREKECEPTNLEVKVTFKNTNHAEVHIYCDTCDWEYHGVLFVRYNDKKRSWMWDDHKDIKKVLPGQLDFLIEY